MNDQFGFDLNPFGIDGFSPQQIQQQPQQQQQQQNAYLSNHGTTNGLQTNTNGPCMDTYDPNQVLMTQQMSPYNMIIGRNNSSSNSNNSINNTASGSNKNGVVRNNHGRHRQSHNTHQLMLQGNLQHSSSRRTNSSSQSSIHGQHQRQPQPQPQIQQHCLQTGGFSDFDPVPMSEKFTSTNGLQSSQNNANNNGLPVGHRGSVQFSYQKQQQQQQESFSCDRGGRTSEKVSSSMTSYLMSSSQQNNQYKQQQRQIIQRQPKSKPKPKKEEWLEKMSAKVPGVSLTPLTGTQIIDLLRKRADEVLSRYLPCVDFLVQCQQELRKGLQVATTKRYMNHALRDTLTPRQFHTQYVAQLPSRFYRKNQRTMSNENLMTAFKELERLVANAKAAESQGCEVVKNTFLGGMKDGESWGLRKWLSKQGGALHICNDTECLSTSCQKLDREAESTQKLAARLRPLAAASLKKLKSEIPSSYQEQSSAHPYLPFFHRLECALRGMANFDPEDDDVICIVDDDEVEELKAKAAVAPPPANKRKRSRNSMSGSNSSNGNSSAKKKKVKEPSFSTAVHDEDSDIEVLDHKPAPKRSKKKSAINGDALDFELETAGDEDESDIMEALMKTLDDNEDQINFDVFDQKSDLDEGNGTRNMNKYNAFDLADGLDHIACLFDSNKDDTVRPGDIEKDMFWDSRLQYASALRLFCAILRSPDCTNAYLESVDEEELVQEGKLPYTEIVKHPISFRDIAASLFHDFNMIENNIKCNDGILPYETTLEDWNMWKGRELLQSIDLVLLNSLAYGKANDGGGKSSTRSRTNKLRKMLWAGIKDVVDETLSSCDAEEKRRCTPTRRGESSGFVVKKGSS